jgi:hypothetical protein
MKGFPHTQSHNVIKTVEKLNFFNTLIVMMFQFYTDVSKIVVRGKIYTRTGYESPYSFFNLSARSDWLVKTKPRLLCLLEKYLILTVQEALWTPKACLVVCGKFRLDRNSVPGTFSFTDYVVQVYTYRYCIAFIRLCKPRFCCILVRIIVDDLMGIWVLIV